MKSQLLGISGYEEGTRNRAVVGPNEMHKEPWHEQEG